ncbi:MAG: hypothetical protein Q9164_006186, partial [Protoblastenia rupestris]
SPHSPNTQQTQYLNLLQSARVDAAATQIPPRNGKNTKARLRELEDVRAGIWVLKKGQSGWSREVRQRKQDFEVAVRREIEGAEKEKSTGRRNRRGGFA